MVLTYVTYAIVGLHSGLWLQSWGWTWALAWVFHVFVYIVGTGRGTAGVLDFWLGRPLTAMLLGSVGYLWYRLMGSPVAGWRVRAWADEDAIAVYRATDWRARTSAAISSWVRVLGRGGAARRVPPVHAVELTDTIMWPLHGRLDVAGAGVRDINRDYTHLQLEDPEEPLPVLAFADEQPPTCYGRNHYLLSFTPGHQLLWDLAVLHTVVLAFLVVAWERWPSVADGTTSAGAPSVIGMAILLPGYVLATLAAAWLARTPANRLWPSRWRMLFFWGGWLALAGVTLGLGCGLGWVHGLHQRWSGALIPLATALGLVLPGLFYILRGASVVYGLGDTTTKRQSPLRRQRLDGTIPSDPIRDVIRPHILVHCGASPYSV